jgi:hypothetical protein
MHRFLTIVETLVRDSGAFREETAVLDALRDIKDFGQTFIEAGEREAVRTENDTAPVEDVRLRRPPGGYAPVPAAAPVQIDYAMLARYIVAAQAEQARADAPPAAPPGTGVAVPEQVHVITDAVKPAADLPVIPDMSTGF